METTPTISSLIDITANQERSDPPNVTNQQTPGTAFGPGKDGKQQHGSIQNTTSKHSGPSQSKASFKIPPGLRPTPMSRESSQVVPALRSTDSYGQDPPSLLFGAEEIAILETGRLATLGGFIMVDDVCFGLTTAHTFLDEETEEDFGQQSITEDGLEPHLYDIDWANEDDSDGNDEGTDPDAPQGNGQGQALQRLSINLVADGRKYRSESGELRHVTASSQRFSRSGLDWALCDLGDYRQYAINAVYLPPNLRIDQSRELLFFNKLKSTPPLGKIFVATRNGVVAGTGTGSGTSIKLGNDDELRRVWSIELESSLSSGDSGAWVVDAESGDVYGMVVAGSSGLHEEYIVPATDIGQDIQQVMRADTVSLPVWQDVPGFSEEREHMGADITGIAWEPDEDMDEDEEV